MHQGTELVDKFVHLVEDLFYVVAHTGVESHSSLGFFEKYIQPILFVYMKLKISEKQIPKELSLSISFKAVNYFSGPDVLTASLLTFGSFLLMHTPHEIQPKKLNPSETQSLQEQALLEMEK